MIKKIFFSDLDGTLLDENHKLTLFTKNIMKQLIKDENYLFIINTGRITKNAIEISKKLGCHKQENGFVISNNGAQIYSFDQNKIIYNKFISTENIIKINEILFPIKNIDVHYYSENSLYTYKKSHESKYWSRLMKANYEIIEDETFFINNKKDNIQRLLIIFENLYNKDEILNKINEKITNIEIKKQTDYIYEIIKKNVNKGTALQYILKKLDIKKGDSISFGDSYNDLQLIKKAGKGLVVKNGVPELKKIADEIIEENKNNGPALYIWKKFIKKEYN